MAMVVRRILGLDLGSHSVKAVELCQTLGGMEVGALQRFPAEDPDDPRPLPERLKSFLRTYKLPTDHLVTALAADRLTGRRLHFPFRDRRKIRQAVPFAIEDDVPFELADLVIDYEIIASDRSQTDVAVCLAPRREVARLLDDLTAAEIEPRILEAEGLSLGNLASWFPLPSACLLADVGHRKTTFCLCVGDRPLASRSVALAGEALTSALSKDRGLGRDAAELVKCEEGLFRGGAPTGAEVGRTLDRLAREFVRTLGGAEAMLTAEGIARVDEILLVGGSALLPGLDAYLSERTGIPTARLAPPDTPEGAAFLAAGDPALYGPAAALALRGTGKARTRSNFRQQEFAPRFDVGGFGRVLAPTALLAGLALLLGGVSMGTAVILQSRRADAAEAQVARLYSEANPGSPMPTDAMAAMRTALREAQDRADFLGVYRGNLSALDLLARISSRVPADLDVVFEELNIDRQVVRIRGHSQSFEAVDRLRTQLESDPLFSQIKVSEIQSEARRGTKSFSLTISLGRAEDA